MPNRTTYLLDAVERMLDAQTPDDLLTIRKMYKSDIVADAYDMLSNPIRLKLHKLMADKGGDDNAR